MPQAQADIPEQLKPFLFHGIFLNWSGSDKNAVGDCPFCGREGKFGVEITTGLFSCFVCAEGTKRGGGNSFVFLRRLHELSIEATTQEDWQELARDRGLIRWETLKTWGVCKSSITGEWLVPGYDIKRKISNLYRYTETSNGRILKSTAGMNHALFGFHLFDEHKKKAKIAEGPWDGMALWEVLSQSKMTDAGVSPTSNPESSFLSETNVVAVPGCSTFYDSWIPAFGDKEVDLLFDSDHPKINPQTKKRIPSAGYSGMKRAVGLLMSNVKHTPTALRYLKWGDRGYNPDLKSGYDIRDQLTTNAPSFQSRLGRLQTILENLEDVPEEWKVNQNHKSNGHTPEIKCIPCQSFEQLNRAWEKAWFWNERLRGGLIFSLAVTASTPLLEDQLWGIIESPPSCLHGSTPIYDPVAKTVLTVEERYNRGEPFHVWGITPEEKVIVTEAEPPQKYAETPIVKIIFENGRVLKVTQDHRIWVEKNRYVSLRNLLSACDRKMYPMPHILDLNIEVGEELVADDWTSISAFEVVGNEPYYDFHVPETNNYWSLGFFHHNTGKSTIADAISVARKYVTPKDTMTGFTSGFVDPEGESTDLATELDGKTLVITDGDTFLKNPNLPRIISESRRLYDGSLASHFKNKTGKECSAHRMTWLLNGTSAIRDLDQSELGARFVTYVIMESINRSDERKIAQTGVEQMIAGMRHESGKGEGKTSKDKAYAMGLTGGYVNYLRENIADFVSELRISEEVKERWCDFGEFVAHMRAKPSKQESGGGRELSARLTKIFTRLALCATVVVNKTEVDDEIMTFVEKVAMDTSRGFVRKITEKLFDTPDGQTKLQLASLIQECEPTTRRLLSFMRHIRIVQWWTPKKNGINQEQLWGLTDHMRQLCERVFQRESPPSSQKEEQAKKPPAKPKLKKPLKPTKKGR